MEKSKNRKSELIRVEAVVVKNKKNKIVPFDKNETDAIVMLANRFKKELKGLNKTDDVIDKFVDLLDDNQDLMTTHDVVKFLDVMTRYKSDTMYFLAKV